MERPKTLLNLLSLFLIVMSTSVYGGWTLDGHLPQPLWFHGSVPIGDGILVFGGAAPRYTVGEAYIYYPGGVVDLSAAWMLSGAQDMAHISHGNKVYSIAGYAGGPTGGGRTVSVLGYDPVANCWSSETSLSYSRASAAGASLGDWIYVIGGHHEDPAHGFSLSIVESYDPSQGGTWTSLAPLNHDREGLRAAVVNGRIYAIGGLKYDYPSVPHTWGGWLEVYDPATNTWSDGPSMPTPRSDFALALLGNKIYTIGGMTFNLALSNTVEYFDTTSHQWFTEDSFPIPVRNASAAVVNGRIYVLGGGIDPLSWAATDTVYVYGGLPPVASAGGDQIVECACQLPEGTQVTLDGSASSDADGDALTYTWTGPFEGSPLSGSEAVATVRLLQDVACQGTYTMALVVNDGQQDSLPDEVTITVQDTTPPGLICPESITVEAQGPDGVPVDDSEVQSFLNAASASDNCDPAPTLSNDAPADYFPITFPIDLYGTLTMVPFTATDESGNTSSCTSAVYVDDTTPPEVEITAPEAYGLYAAGSLTLGFSAEDLVSGSIAPPNLMGTLVDAAQLSQEVEPGYVPGVGVYTLCVSAVDEAGNLADPESAMFVVFDPEGGFVTGGGWIWSSAGAYAPDTSLAGKANFGFVSKYRKGTNEPTGQTEFIFQTGDLNFHSTSYEYLVVTGSNYARFKGVGTINGYGAYKFMIWAHDAPDTFRIKIWEEPFEEDPIYDNGMDQGIDGGSIVVHAN